MIALRPPYAPTGRPPPMIFPKQENGIYLAPSQFEAFFLSAAHDDDAIDRTLAAAEAVFARL